MPLEMNREVFITCAVTGSGGSQDKSPHVPRSPKQIADSAIDAAKAGAAVVHCHVRDPETGVPSRDLALYRELTERILVPIIWESRPVVGCDDEEIDGF